jgi:hypothetical protein
MATRDEKLDAKMAKRVDKKVARGIRKSVLPVAAGTEGIARGAAKVFEGTKKENVIRSTQRTANQAAANTKSVASRAATGPIGRAIAKTIVKKNVKRGMKEGGAVARQMLGAAAKDARRGR